MKLFAPADLDSLKTAHLPCANLRSGLVEFTIHNSKFTISCHSLHSLISTKWPAMAAAAAIMGLTR
jgi:hypothetical protein